MLFLNVMLNIHNVIQIFYEIIKSIKKLYDGTINAISLCQFFAILFQI